LLILSQDLKMATDYNDKISDKRNQKKKGSVDNFVF
jgi:hypothetical protein